MYARALTALLRLISLGYCAACDTARVLQSRRGTIQFSCAPKWERVWEAAYALPVSRLMRTSTAHKGIADGHKLPSTRSHPTPRPFFAAQNICAQNMCGTKLPRHTSEVGGGDDGG